MSRSIDSRKRDLKRDRKFAQQDGLPVSPQMTVLDQDGIKKTIYKLNATWRKQSANSGTPVHAELGLDKDGAKSQIVRRLKRRRDK
jgi:hypothetical protein